jgi:hypothetical protein
MANAAAYVAVTRRRIGDFMAAVEQLNAALSEYNALGGSGFTDDHWLDEQGAPRADLDITAAQFVDAVASIQAVQALLAQGHATNL